jgi:hypothetical protein
MDPLVILIIGPIAVLVVFALALAWRHPRRGTEIIGKSISAESESNARIKRRPRPSAGPMDRRPRTQGKRSKASGTHPTEDPSGTGD